MTDDPKNPEEPSLQSRAAKARWAGLSKDERRRLASDAARRRWHRADPSMPKALRQGELRLGDVQLPCFIIDGKEKLRVLTQSGMAAALGISKGGDRKVQGDRIANMLAANRLKPFVSGRLASISSEVLRFATPNGMAANGYRASLLADVCDALIEAGRAGVFRGRQAGLPLRAKVLKDAFAKVGIDALVDEATGYQDERPRDELAELLRLYVVEEMQKWVSTFPPDYYREIFRLNGWHFADKNAKARPPVVGKYTNNIVYARLAPGVLEELRRVNPVRENGWRKAKHHQHLTEDRGHPKLREHLTGLIYLMKANTTWRGFLNDLDKAQPAWNTNYALDLGDSE